MGDDLVCHAPQRKHCNPFPLPITLCRPSVNYWLPGVNFNFTVHDDVRRQWLYNPKLITEISYNYLLPKEKVANTRVAFCLQFEPYLLKIQGTLL